MSTTILENLREVEVVKPSDLIIQQIKGLIASGQLKPGDRLPSERVLSEKFGLGRTHVRDALKTLEVYGVLKTLPQSGTVVSGLGLTALEGLISNILEVESPDFASLVETRLLLELESARLAALRRTDANLLEIKGALDAYLDRMQRNGVAVEEDMMLHLKIAEASQNSVLKSLMMIIIPDILNAFSQYHICDEVEAKQRYREHLSIYERIADKDSDGAVAAMREHLHDIMSRANDIAYGH
jgi:GntR family transcriptional regulator, transcriptional repressor for pyruvate dehydrogenase complex